MALNPADIIGAICPDLATSPRLETFLAMAVELTAREYFGRQYDYAVAYRACHLFAQSGGSGRSDVTETLERVGGGASVASLSEGGMSVSFAQGAASSGGTADLSSTRYGKMLLALIKARPTMGVNTAGLSCKGLPPAAGLR
jgi:hypothetical protein